MSDVSVYEENDTKNAKIVNENTKTAVITASPRFQKILVISFSRKDFRISLWSKMLEFELLIFSVHYTYFPLPVKVPE